MKFNASVIGALASILTVGSALAADLPSYKAPPPPPSVPSFSWTGAHVGVVAAYAGGSSSYNSTVWAFAPTFAIWPNVNTSRGTTGYTIGVESGYSWQFANNVVLGYESDFSYADISTNNDGVWGSGLRTRANWFGSERLRFGYAFGRFLPYITGGLTYGLLSTNGVTMVPGLFFPTSSSHWQAGWNVGAGIEWAVMDNVSVKAEYLHASLPGLQGGGIGISWDTAAPAGYRSFVGNGYNVNIARVGVNYHLKSLGALIGLPNIGL
jgi:outer membrane immunogenic protein